MKKPNHKEGEKFTRLFVCLCCLLVLFIAVVSYIIYVNVICCFLMLLSKEQFNFVELKLEKGCVYERSCIFKYLVELPGMQ